MYKCISYKGTGCLLKTSGLESVISCQEIRMLQWSRQRLMVCFEWHYHYHPDKYSCDGTSELEMTFWIESLIGMYRANPSAIYVFRMRKDIARVDTFGMVFPFAPDWFSATHCHFWKICDEGDLVCHQYSHLFSWLVNLVYHEGLNISWYKATSNKRLTSCITVDI